MKVSQTPPQFVALSHLTVATLVSTNIPPAMVKHCFLNELGEMPSKLLLGEAQGILAAIGGQDGGGKLLKLVHCRTNGACGLLIKKYPGFMGCIRASDNGF